MRQDKLIADVLLGIHHPAVLVLFSAVQLRTGTVRSGD